MALRRFELVTIGNAFKTRPVELPLKIKMISLWPKHIYIYIYIYMISLKIIRETKITALFILI